MTTQHINSTKRTITATWKEDNITPLWRKEIERNQAKKPQSLKKTEAKLS